MCGPCFESWVKQLLLKQTNKQIKTLQVNLDTDYEIMLRNVFKIMIIFHKILIF